MSGHAVSNEVAIYEKTKSLSSIEKIHLVEMVLSDLDRPNHSIAEIWERESKKRWDAYCQGKVVARDHEEVMDKYLR